MQIREVHSEVVWRWRDMMRERVRPYLIDIFFFSDFAGSREGMRLQWKC